MSVDECLHIQTATRSGIPGEEGVTQQGMAAAEGGGRPPLRERWQRVFHHGCCHNEESQPVRRMI